MSVAKGGAVTPTSTVTSGLYSGDTAAVVSATYTYAGTGTTTYAASTTAPTAAGTYSVTPSAASVTITPSADAGNYSTTYTYVAGTLTISPPSLTVTAASQSVKDGGNVTGSAVVSGLQTGDTATVQNATYTYAGTGIDHVRGLDHCADVSRHLLGDALGRHGIDHAER